jgi:hypothetical protein
MQRGRPGFVAFVVLVVLGSGCSSSSDDAKSSDASRSTKPAIVCNGADEFNQDDDGAVPALLQRAQLPPGAWTTAKTPPCPWALSADELLATPECRALAAAAKAPANDEARNGNARITYAGPDAALGLGFPAVAGYPADAGFADSVDITFTRTTKGSSTPVAMRVITFGSGGLMSTVTLIGTTTDDLDAVDFDATLQAAAKNYVDITSPN